MMTFKRYMILSINREIYVYVNVKVKVRTWENERKPYKILILTAYIGFLPSYDAGPLTSGLAYQLLSSRY